MSLRGNSHARLWAELAATGTSAVGQRALRAPYGLRVVAGRGMPSAEMVLANDLPEAAGSAASVECYGLSGY